MTPLERLTANLDDLTTDQRAHYMAVALGILGRSCPDVLETVLDLTDERIAVVGS